MFRGKNKEFKRQSGLGFNSVGIIIIVAMFAFVVGNRWSDIIDSFGTQTDQNSQLPNDLNYEEVENVYDLLRVTYDGELTEDQLIEGLKDGLTRATGDPYTTYLDAEAAEQFTNDLNGTFSGIGAELGVNDNEQLIIVAPLDGFPAQQAGVRAQDIIVQIDGEDSINLSIEEAVSKIRGETGTDVTLTLARDGQRIDVTITRETIVLPSVESELLENDTIGYLQISRFAEDTVGLARNAANDFVDRGISKVILDLRNNSGGFLDGAVNITGLWAENEVAVEQREGDTVTDTLRTGSNAPLKGIETVILVNQGSASASEIVAGALQDLGLATVVGEQSFGKGSVQALERLRHGGVLKVTIARWYTPNGRSIDNDGVTPDVEVEITEEDFEAERDSQRDRAIELLSN